MFTTTSVPRANALCVAMGREWWRDRPGNSLSGSSASVANRLPSSMLSRACPAGRLAGVLAALWLTVAARTVRASAAGKA